MLTGGLGNAILWTSMHIGDPGVTGANEQTLTGSPAYGRKGVTWGTATAGRRTNSAAVTHDIPAGTYYAVGFWSLATAGTFYGYALLNPTLVAGFGVAAAAGDVVTSNAHGLVNGNRVQVFNVLSEVIPAGLTEGNFYYVVGVTTDTFQLSITEGGAAIDITASGEIFWQKLVPDTYTGQATVVLSIGSLALDVTLV